VRPITLISGSSPFCEAFFREVRVPVANVIGKINGGWTVAKALLGHERSMIADAFGGGSGSTRGLALPELARRYLGSEEARLADPLLRDAIAQNEMDTRCFHLTVQRARDAAKAGHAPGPESSLFKVYATELNQRRYELMMRFAAHARMAALARQHDRRRHLRDPAQHHRQARAAASRLGRRARRRIPRGTAICSSF
jgi:alkylation response protein AidB-like acyl-CoA dehydrogenase